MNLYKHWKCLPSQLFRAADITWYLLFFYLENMSRIRQIYKALTEKLVAKSVAAVMFQNDALSISELESIQHEPTETKAAESLLNLALSSQTVPCVYECLMEALKQTNQQHIFMYISYPGKK